MEKLAFLKTQYAHLPKQGTDAWRESRRTKIGGSEVAAAIGKSPYLKPAALLVRKIDRVRLDKSAACTFGRVFEDVAKHHIEVTYGITVHELGAIPCSRYPVCYSPDGVIVEGRDLVLVEIKCPFRRSKIQEVPAHYLCQVQTGMSVLPCERAYFYQFRFRCCKIADMGPSPAYNRWLHFESRKRCPDRPPLAWGYLHWDEDTDLIDLGALSGDDSVKLCFVNNLTATIHHAEDTLPTTGYVLPWKLFDHTRVVVPRDPKFLDECQDLLWGAYGHLTKKQ